MADETATPQLPEDLTALDDEALENLHDEFQTRGRTLLAAAKARDAEVLGERTQADVDDELTTIATALSTIRAEQKSRKADTDAFDAKLETFEAELGSDDDETPEEDGDTAETAQDEEPDAEDGDEEPEAETASAATKRTRRPIPLASKRHQPRETETDERGFRSQIRAEPLSIGYGDQLDQRGIGELLHHAVRRVATPGQSLTVATALFPFPDDRNLGSADGKQRVDPGEPRIRKALDERGALVASGAICAPAEPIYDVPNISVGERPVRAALTSFQASRGSVIVRGGIQMGDYEDATGHITAENNEAGGSLAVKNCMRIECPDPETVVVDSIYHCIEADNLAAKSDPELMSAITAQVLAEQARLADGFLLDRIKSYSNAVTGIGTSGNGGVLVHLLGDVAKQAAAYRSAHRMARGATLQALFPDWIIDALTLDLMKAAFDHPVPASRAAAEAEFRGLLAAFGVNASFHIDGSSTASNGQVFAHWANSTLVGFPATVEWFIFAPGTFLHLDAGSLDLGIVRDSNLNATNDFQEFAETWENIAFVGIESRVVTSTICPSGTFALAKDLSAVC